MAAKRFRERGLSGIGIAEIMKEAGSTVGGFYKHFDSRDDLVIEALAEAFKDLDVLERAAKDLPGFIEMFLSEEHRDNIGSGCGVTAFAQEIAHTGTGVRTVYTQRVRQTLGYYVDRLQGVEVSSRRTRAILLLSAAVGGLALARSVNDDALSGEILVALRTELLALARETLPRGRERRG